LPRLIPLAVAGLLLATATATAAAAHAADAPATPSWLKTDAAAKKAGFDAIAAFNENNSNWNFNGYHSGNATVLVPPGWTVEVPFLNEEADVPHSLVVMADPGSEDEYPSEAAADVAAFPGAYSVSPVEGTAKGTRADFSFTADKAGDYLWYCGVPGHGSAGMWIRFRVTEDVTAPALALADDGEPGRE
jgi:sulfocyanin